MAHIDLHQHSLHSFDATGLPSHRLRGAFERGVKAIAITDHNSVESLNELVDWVGMYPSVDVLPGCEFDAWHPEIGTLHYVALGFNQDDAGVRLLCERYTHRTHIIVDRLIEVGRQAKPELTRRDVMKTAIEGGYKRLIPYHVMMALYYMHVPSDDIYSLFRTIMPTEIGTWLPSHRELFDTVHAAQGLVVCAHPGRYPRDCPVMGMGAVGPPPGLPEAKLIQLFSDGLDALETNQPSNMGKNDIYDALAKKNGWPRSGGTDYHGWDIPEVQTLSAWLPETPAEYLDELDAAAMKRHGRRMHRIVTPA